MAKGDVGRARLWATWVELPCGCATSDRGSFILDRRCPRHHHMVPEERWRRMNGVGNTFGPVRPRRG